MSCSLAFCYTLVSFDGDTGNICVTVRTTNNNFCLITSDAVIGVIACIRSGCCSINSSGTFYTITSVTVVSQPSTVQVCLTPLICNGSTPPSRPASCGSLTLTGLNGLTEMQCSCNSITSTPAFTTIPPVIDTTNKFLYKESGNCFEICGQIDISGTTVPNNYVYVNQNQEPNAIAAFSVDPNGTLTAVSGSPFPTGGNGNGYGFFEANIEAVCIIGNRLYATNTADNTVSGFTINLSSGALTPIGVFNTNGRDSYGGSLACTPDGKYLFVSEDLSNNITSFSIDPVSGALTPVPDSPFGAGLPSNSGLGGMMVSPNGQFLVVTLSNTNQVAVFGIDPLTGAISPIPGSPFDASSFGSAAGVDINCDSNLVFVGKSTSSMGSAVDVFTMNSVGVLTLASTFTSDAASNSNIVLLSPDNRFLFVSNQDSNTISVLQVDYSTNTLTAITGSPFANPDGGFPLNMATNITGTLLYVTDGASGNLIIFNIASNGSLMTNSFVPIGSFSAPMAVNAFLPANCPPCLPTSGAFPTYPWITFSVPLTQLSLPANFNFSCAFGDWNVCARPPNNTTSGQGTSYSGNMYIQIADGDINFYIRNNFDYNVSCLDLLNFRVCGRKLTGGFG